MFKKIKDYFTKESIISKLKKENTELRVQNKLLVEYNKAAKQEIDHIYTQGFYKLFENPNFRILGLTVGQVSSLKNHYRATTGQDAETIKG